MVDRRRSERAALLTLRRHLRDLVTWSVLWLAVAAAVGFAWLTRHPSAPIVAVVAEWPVLGAAARLFQARWLPPLGSVVVDSQPGGGSTTTRIWVPVREVEVEDFFDLPPREESPRAIPWSRDPMLSRNDAPLPLGNDPAPALPLPGRRADADRLAEAVSLFAAPPAETRLGGYSLMTDVEDPALVARVAAVAAETEPLYLSRYGLALAGTAAEAIVLYRSEEAYRRLEERSERIRGLASRGHVGWGLVALYAGEGREIESVEAVLRHELAHLLNRRALGPALPAWLDEGIADDFAAFELDPSLEPRESPLESLRTVYGARIELRGALAGLERLAAAIDAGRSPPLRSLFDLDWSEFVAEPASGLHYAASAWVVRYLLDESTGHRLAFRSFLRQVARGGQAGAADLERALEAPLSDIEPGWRAYVVERAIAAGVAAPASEDEVRANPARGRARPG